MKRIKKDDSRSMLGLTQLELAMLLKVTRSQWSHYERGSRLLPNGAGSRYLEMVAYMVLPETEALRQSANQKYEGNYTKTILEKRLKENEYQLMVIAREIPKVQEKFEKYSKALQLTDFLNSPKEFKKAANPEGLSSITSDSIANYNKNKSQLILLDIDQRILQHEETLLKAALEEIK